MPRLRRGSSGSSTESACCQCARQVCASSGTFLLRSSGCHFRRTAHGQPDPGHSAAPARPGGLESIGYVIMSALSALSIAFSTVALLVRCTRVLDATAFEIRLRWASGHHVAAGRAWHEVPHPTRDVDLSPSKRPASARGFGLRGPPGLGIAAVRDRRRDWPIRDTSGHFRMTRLCARWSAGNRAGNRGVGRTLPRTG